MFMHILSFLKPTGVGFISQTNPKSQVSTPNSLKIHSRVELEVFLMWGEGREIKIHNLKKRNLQTFFKKINPKSRHFGLISFNLKNNSKQHHFELIFINLKRRHLKLSK